MRRPPIGPYSTRAHPQNYRNSIGRLSDSNFRRRIERDNNLSNKQTNYTKRTVICRIFFTCRLLVNDNPFIIFNCDVRRFCCGRQPVGGTSVSKVSVRRRGVVYGYIP